jgi:hypothetical protein
LFIDLLVPMLLRPRCRGGYDHRACRPPNIGAPPSSALGWARLLGSLTSNAAIVVALAAAVVVLVLLAFADERAPPPLSWCWWLGLHRIFLIYHFPPPPRHRTGDAPRRSTVGSLLVRVCNCCNLRMVRFGCKTVCVAVVGFD